MLTVLDYYCLLMLFRMTPSEADHRGITHSEARMLFRATDWPGDD